VRSQHQQSGNGAQILDGDDLPGHFTVTMAARFS
jgi:hypothetical protein